jgi:hypothetical protein
MRQKQKKILMILILGNLFLFVPLFAFAQNLKAEGIFNRGLSLIWQEEGLYTQCDIIQKALNISIFIFEIVIGFTIISGIASLIFYLLSKKDPLRVGQARIVITPALFGLFFAFSFWLSVNIVKIIFSQKYISSSIFAPQIGCENYVLTQGELGVSQAVVPKSVHFTYQPDFGSKDRYQENGAEIWIPKEAVFSGTFPLFVLLHGKNNFATAEEIFTQKEDLLKVKTRTQDLISQREVQPVIFAFPTNPNTQEENIWHDFDITSFINQVQFVLDQNPDAKNMKIGNLIIGGEGSAGCQEGLARIDYTKVEPFGLILADTCSTLGSKITNSIPKNTKVIVVYGQQDKEGKVASDLGIVLGIDCPQEFLVGAKNCKRHPNNEWYSFYYGGRNEALPTGVETALKMWFKK